MSSYLSCYFAYIYASNSRILAEIIKSADGSVVYFRFMQWLCH